MSNMGMEGRIKSRVEMEWRTMSRVRMEWRTVYGGGGMEDYV